MRIKNTTTGFIGLLAVATFIITLLVFGSIHPNFSFVDDYISKLGAKGEPNALLWNLTGFVLVGLLLATFGFMYGRLLKDRLLSILLSLFGLGFALTSIPMDMDVADATVSKAHIAIICFGLAFWLFGLSRMTYKPQLVKRIKSRANITAVLLVVSMIGSVLGWWSMPVTHRLVFAVVFGWTTITSIDLSSGKQLSA